MEFVSPPTLEVVAIIYNNGLESEYDMIPVSIERTFTARIIGALPFIYQVRFNFVGINSSGTPENFLVVFQQENSSSSYLNPNQMSEELFADLCTQLNNMFDHATAVVREAYANMEQHIVELQADSIEPNTVVSIGAAIEALNNLNWEEDSQFDDTETVYTQHIESDHE